MAPFRLWLSSLALSLIFGQTIAADAQEPLEACQQWSEESGTVTCTGPSQSLYVNTPVYAELANADGTFNCKNPNTLLIRNSSRFPARVSSTAGGVHNQEIPAKGKWNSSLAIYHSAKDAPLKVDLRVSYCSNPP